MCNNCRAHNFASRSSCFVQRQAQLMISAERRARERRRRSSEGPGASDDALRRRAPAALQRRNRGTRKQERGAKTTRVREEGKRVRGCGEQCGYY